MEQHSIISKNMASHGFLHTKRGFIVGIIDNIAIDNNLPTRIKRHYMMNCHKKPFTTRAKAKKAMKEYQKIYDKEYSLYKCQNCDQFHLTTMTKSKSRHISRFKRGKYSEMINELRELCMRLGYDRMSNKEVKLMCRELAKDEDVFFGDSLEYFYNNQDELIKILS